MLSTSGLFHSNGEVSSASIFSTFFSLSGKENPAAPTKPRLRMKRGHLEISHRPQLPLCWAWASHSAKEGIQGPPIYLKGAPETWSRVHPSPRVARRGQAETRSKCFTRRTCSSSTSYCKVHLRFKSDSTVSQASAGRLHKQLGGPMTSPWGSLSSP